MESNETLRLGWDQYLFKVTPAGAAVCYYVPALDAHGE